MIGLLWSLPVTLIGVVVFLFLGPQSVRVRWRGMGVFLVFEVRVSRMPGRFAGMTFGHAQAYGAEPSERLRSHEDVHTLQGDLFGILDLPIYGVCSVVSRLRGTGWYRGNAMEAWARKWSR
jgi:hypothetical protein